MKKAQTGGMMGLIGGVVLISIFTVVFMIILSSAKQSSPNLVYDQSQYAGFDQTNEVLNITQDMTNQFTNANASGTNSGDIITVATTGGYNTLKILRVIPSVYASMLFGTAQILGVPSSIAQLIAFIPIIAVLTLFVLLIFRVNT